MNGIFVAWRARYVDEYGWIRVLTGWTTWLVGRHRGSAARADRFSRENRKEGVTMLIGKYDDVLVKLWTSLSSEEKWVLVAERKTKEIATIGDIFRIRSALRECLAPRSLS